MRLMRLLRRRRLMRLVRLVRGRTGAMPLTVSPRSSVLKISSSLNWWSVPVIHLSAMPRPLSAPRRHLSRPAVARVVRVCRRPPRMREVTTDRSAWPPLPGTSSRPPGPRATEVSRSRPAVGRHAPPECPARDACRCCAAARRGVSSRGRARPRAWAARYSVCALRDTERRLDLDLVSWT